MPVLRLLLLIAAWSVLPIGRAHTQDAGDGLEKSRWPPSALDDASTSPGPIDPLGLVGQEERTEPALATLEQSPEQPQPPVEDDKLRWRGSMDWFFSLQGTLPAQGQLNPDNRVLHVPSGIVSNQLRPNLRFEFSSLQLVVRPRFSVAWQATNASGETDWKQWTSSVDWPEVYGSWRLGDSLAVTYGLQNYQWGPGETLNPTNTIIHRPYSRNILTLIRGKQLVRVNISSGRRLSAILLVEPADNGEAPFVYGEKFEPKILLRAELTSESGSSHFGVAAGAGGAPSAWFGEYGSLALTDALSVYVDARHQHGSIAWYPAPVGSNSETGFLHAHKNDIQTIGIAGARYSFENGIDVRGEYIQNDPGYTRSEERQATRNVLARAGANPAVLGYLNAPGLDLPGRKYAYASIRAPDLGRDDALTLDFRVLKTLSDNTAAMFLNVEWITTDAWVLFMSSMATVGDSDGDLTRLLRGYAIAGSRYTW